MVLSFPSYNKRTDFEGDPIMYKIPFCIGYRYKIDASLWVSSPMYFEFFGLGTILGGRLTGRQSDLVTGTYGP